MQGPPISSAAELDWEMAKKAAADILKICSEAGFTAPEAIDLHLMKIDRICVAIDAIADALKLRKV